MKTTLMHIDIQNDYFPGGVGGKEAITALLKIDPNIKAVVSSGYSTDPVMANYQEYGFSAAHEQRCQVFTHDNVTGGDQTPLTPSLRVGDWRVVYTIHEQALLIAVVRIAPRGDVCQ